MKIDFSKILCNIDGTQMQEAKDKPLTLDKVCVNAILSEMQGETASGVEKVERFKLAKKICGASEIDITIEEAAQIKERVGKLYLPLIVGQIFEILEDKK
ncbi:MAG: hypothetical protein IMZ53_02910 [Thermoplasmata archaeon]|nr:hypothetical protein [Thermoplasmata archaeon]